MSPDELRRMFPHEVLRRNVEQPRQVPSSMASMATVVVVIVGIIGLAMAIMREPSAYIERRAPTPAAIDYRTQPTLEPPTPPGH